MNELQNFEYLKFQYHKENLHDVFGTVLNSFPHITGATVTGQIYLWDVLQRIKYNLASDIEPETYLLHKYIDGVEILRMTREKNNYLRYAIMPDLMAIRTQNTECSNKPDVSGYR